MKKTNIEIYIKILPTNLKCQFPYRILNIPILVILLSVIYTRLPSSILSANLSVSTSLGEYSISDIFNKISSFILEKFLKYSYFIFEMSDINIGAVCMS